MPRRSSTLDLLSHLKPCKKCEYYVGAPMMCKGQADASKKGYWYENCLNNEQPTPDSCDYFAWRQDIDHGKGSRGKTPCPGVLCRQLDKLNSCNVECTFGICVKCCRHLQPLLTTVRSCSVSDHRKGVVYPEADMKADKKVDKEPQAGAWGQASKGKKVHKKPAVDKSLERAGETDPVLLPPSCAPPKRSSYATPTGLAYQARMSALDAEHQLNEECHADRARQEQANSHVQVFTLHWWTKNGGVPDVVELAIDKLSSFHPKDNAQLVDDYRCDTERFQYYDSKKHLWYTGSRGSAPHDLNKLGEDDLCYRSAGVTWGEDMPGSTKKWPAPEDSPAGDTPRRPLLPFAEYPNTPTSSHRHSNSPAGTTPPRSGSSMVLQEPQPDQFSSAFDLDFMLSLFPAGQPPYSAINESIPRLLALFPTDLDVTGTAYSSSELDISSAPHGHGRITWPWRYVCDMAMGFDTIRALEDAHPLTLTADAFEKVFKAKFKYSTYQDQLRAWREAGKVPGEQDHWIRKGRRDGGEWVAFMTCWHR